MNGKMKAAILEEIGVFSVEEVDIPQIGPKDVLLKVSVAGICGSDLPIYTKGLFVLSLPFIIGHEYSAVVVEKGAEVDDNIKIGDRCMGFCSQLCGECFWCKRGEYQHCAHGSQHSFGFGIPGCFAEYTVVKNAVAGANLFQIPNSISDVQGAMIEPMAVGAGNVKNAGVKEGDKVVVIGAGIIGASHYQAAKAKGAEVAVFDFSPLRLQLAKDFGADHVFNPQTDGDADEVIIDLWGNGPMHYTPGDRVGGMADHVFECAGKPQAFCQSFKMARAGGSVTIAATHKELAPVDPQTILYKKLAIHHGMNSDIHESIRLLSEKKFKVDQFVTHTYSLDEIDAAFTMQMNPADCMKAILMIGR